jgi:catechol 2,3-dioxygenase-like lactoylglutathione lyase family enzyme
MADFAVPMLPTRNLGTSLGFYSALGFEHRAGWPPDPYLLVGRGTLEIEFFATSESNFVGCCHLYVGDVESWHAQCARLGLPTEGIASVSPLTTSENGFPEFGIVDPDGNLVRVGALVGAAA